MFHSNRKGIYNLYWKLSSGAGADELLLESDQIKVPTDWSSDGRFLLFRTQDPQTVYDLWVLKDKTIVLEVCPKSNVQTRAVESYAAHPIDHLFRLGLSVTINTDGRTLSTTSCTHEFQSLMAHKGWTLHEFWQCQHNAAVSAFASADTKRSLLAAIREAQAR